MNKILLFGGSGQLGKEIINSRLFDDIYSPKKEICDFKNKKSIDKLLNEYKPTHIINCAALARRKICEELPEEAISINIIGTSNLVQSILNFSKYNKKPRLLHISTDAVYKCDKGNYKEEDPTIPICNYGWTKLAAECSIRLLDDFIILRTRFFNPSNIPFDDAAEDIFTSSIPIKKLVEYISKLLFNKYIGVLNVGEKGKSDFENYKLFKPDLKRSNIRKIKKESNLPFCNNYSLSTKKFNHLILDNLN